MNPPEPHWTAILAALLTPTVAIIAVYVALINARTARNKLKLDLFDKRIKVFSTIRDFLRGMVLRDELGEAVFIPLVDAFNEAQFLFNDKVHLHLKNQTFEVCKRFHNVFREYDTLSENLRDMKLGQDEFKKQSDELLKRRNAIREELIDEEREILRLCEPFLQLSQ
ncbi:hypothetical protein ACSFBX_22240 [Variovorax sp. RB2P76]|uniref:hypothetical protein n=1 Tax=Variovorax sp. RB2P76 TaxID=3443736 RepID=UPI003F44C9BF